MSALDPFGEVMMLGEWPVMLPAYRVEHCRVQPNWEEGRLRSMHAHLKPGDVLYDVGSEHGDLSALYGTWVRQRGRDYVNDNVPPGPDFEHGGVVLVEGSDRFWPVIRATFEANDLVPVACFAGFASDTDTPESLRTPSWAWPMLTISSKDDGWPSWADGPPEPHHGFKSLVESKETIPNITFDTLAAWVGPPDAMTIDVEGAELRVLQGSERILRDHRPLVWVSIHPTLIAMDYPEDGGHGTGDPDRERQRVIGFMLDLGYDAFHIEDNHEEHWFFPPEEQSVDFFAGIEYLREPE